MIGNNTPHKRTVVGDGFGAGLYAWQMEDGKILGDGEGNVLNIESVYGDMAKMAALARFVKEELGIEGGHPKFLGGSMRLSEDEHDDQMQQMLDGYIPSYDLGSAKDDAIRKKKSGG